MSGFDLGRGFFLLITTYTPSLFFFTVLFSFSFFSLSEELQQIKIIALAEIAECRMVYILSTLPRKSGCGSDCH